MSEDKMIHVTLERDVRLYMYIKGMGRMLGHTIHHFSRGEKIVIGPPEEASYDDREQLAFPVQTGLDEQAYVLQEELQLLEYAQQALELKLKSTCAASDEQTSLRDLFRRGAQRALEAKGKKQNVEPKVVGACNFCGGDVVERHAMALIPIASMRMGESNPTVIITSCSVCKLMYDGPPGEVPGRRELVEELRKLDDWLVSSMGDKKAENRE